MEPLSLAIAAGILLAIILQVWIYFYTMKIKHRDMENRMVESTKLLLRKLDKLEYELKHRGIRKWKKT